MLFSRQLIWFSSRDQKEKTIQVRRRTVHPLAKDGASGSGFQVEWVLYILYMFHCCFFRYVKYLMYFFMLQCSQQVNWIWCRLHRTRLARCASLAASRAKSSLQRSAGRVARRPVGISTFERLPGSKKRWSFFSCSSWSSLSCLKKSFQLFNCDQQSPKVKSKNCVPNRQNRWSEALKNQGRLTWPKC